ncbi:TMhelix containing protein [Vibrio phage 275E43-1]|nr:TMhelix containing protein [Vibrio phage 275E43-1]
MNPTVKAIMLYAAVLLLTYIFASVQAKAEGVEVLAGGWSYHYDRNDQNETHDLLGLCYERVCAARFVNSHNETSVLGYYYHPFLEGEWWNVNGKLGIMGGYEGHVDERYEVGGFIPMVGLGVSFEAFTVDSTSIWVDSTLTPTVAMFNLRIPL